MSYGGDMVKDLDKSFNFLDVQMVFLGTLGIFVHQHLMITHFLY